MDDCDDCKLPVHSELTAPGAETDGGQVEIGNKDRILFPCGHISVMNDHSGIQPPLRTFIFDEENCLVHCRRRR